MKSIACNNCAYSTNSYIASYIQQFIYVSHTVASYIKHLYTYVALQLRSYLLGTLHTNDVDFG